MQACDIGFVVSKNNYFSRFLAYVMGSKWSHSFLVRNTIETLETNMLNVHVDSLLDHMTNPNKSVEVYSPIGMSLEERKYRVQIVEKALLGKLYNYLLMIFLGIRCLFKRKFKNPFKLGVVCESVPCLALGMDMHDMDTEEFYQWIKNNPNYILVFKRD